METEITIKVYGCMPDDLGDIDSLAAIEKQYDWEVIQIKDCTDLRKLR